MQALSVVCSYDISLSYTVSRVCKELSKLLAHIKYGYLSNCRLPLQIIQTCKRLNSTKYNYVYVSNRYHAILTVLYGILSCPKTTLLVTTTGDNPLKDYLPKLRVTTWVNLKMYGVHYYERVIIMYTKPYNCQGNINVMNQLRHSNVWYFGDSWDLPLLFTNLISSNSITRMFSSTITPKLHVQLLDIDYLLGINNYISTAEFCRNYPDISHHYVDNYAYRYNQLLLLAVERLLLTEDSTRVSLYHRGSNKCNHQICEDCDRAIDDLSKYTQIPYSHRIILAAEVTPKIIEFITYQCYYKDVSIAILYSNHLQGKTYAENVLSILAPYNPVIHNS